MVQNKEQDKKPKPRTTAKKTAVQSSKKPKSTIKKPTSKKVKDDTTFIRETAENIEAGIKVVGNKASDVAEKISDKTSKIASDLYDKVKKGVTEAYEFSSKAVDELGKSAQVYIDKYETSIEMRKLRDQRNKIATELGEKVYADLKNKKIEFKNVVEDSEIKEKIIEITKLDKVIIKVGKKIESTKKK